MSKRIIFAGTPDFAAAHLQALLEHQHSHDYQVVAVYTQPDRPAGRGKKLQASPVKQVALAAGIPVYQPSNFKNEEDRQVLNQLQADLMVVVAYGLLLPQAVLDSPRLGCINVHGSLLPRWRGAAPIQRAIEAGDSVSGVGIMQMEAGLDTGPVLLEKQVNIDCQMTGGELHDALMKIGCEALIEAIGQIEVLQAQTQSQIGVTYAHKISKDESLLDWQQSAEVIHNQIRAFDPWPGRSSRLLGEDFKLFASEVISNEQQAASAGTLLEASKQGLDIACAPGIIRIKQLQASGKKRLNVADLLNGRKDQWQVGIRWGQDE